MLLSVLAAAAESSGDTLPGLPAPAQYGILGLLIAALLSGRFVVAKWTYDRERDRADKMEQEIARLNTLIQEKAIPAIVSSSSAIQQSTLLVHEIQREREIQREIRRNDGA